MNRVILSFGSNQGERIGWLQKAFKLIEINCGRIIKQSSIYETAAWGVHEQPDFLNTVIELETLLLPLDLLEATNKIEDTLGRQRTVKWGPRTLDIDLLFFNNDIYKYPTLKIPHPFIQERRFILLPLAEIAPTYIHPVLQQSVIELLAICPDKLEVNLSLQHLG